MPRAANGQNAGMPEGHLLHHYARLHRARLVGKVAATSPQGRIDTAALEGHALVDAQAYGKHLFHHWDDDSVVHVHLGKQGLFLHHDHPAPPARRQVRLRLAGHGTVADLIAPRVCEHVTVRERAAVIDGLGPDPIRDDADPGRVRAALSATRTAIGTALLDQSIVAGVGNVLRAEVLHIVRVAPNRPAAELGDEEFSRLWEELVTTMRRAADEGRISTTVPTTHTGDGRYVYRQERCRTCGRPVVVRPVGGRDCFACTHCQPGW